MRKIPLPFTQDSFWIADLELSELRLFDDANLLWLILVPKREGVIELIDLSEKDQGVLLREINFVSHFIKKNFKCDKLNIASLGNLTPQLHVHMIARCKDDPYFPKAPFGMPRHPYPVGEREALIQKTQGIVHETFTRP